MKMEISELIVRILFYVITTFGLSTLLVNYSGPFNIIGFIRDNLTKLVGANNNFMNCIFCTSTWISILFSIIDYNYYVDLTPFSLIVGIEESVFGVILMLLVNIGFTSPLAMFLSYFDDLYFKRSKKDI